MIIHGDCLQEMSKMDSNSISCIVTDPPYGLSFMGKDWDHGIPGVEFWKQALRVCKPGAFMLAFGGTRTYHRLTCAIEDAGWEIRDCLMWIYGSGFPKSHNHFGLDGYGTALKPAYEPIIMAMKPCEGTFKQNAEKWGQAGININESRIKTNDVWVRDRRNNKDKENITNCFSKGIRSALSKSQENGRWPANILFDEEAGEILDEQSGILKSGNIDPYISKSDGFLQGCKGKRINSFQGDKGGASRFFYCAKASSKERNDGCEDFLHIESCRTMGKDSRDRPIPKNQNHHPTVKPLALMQYLIKLIMPPKDGIILDPFAGSGSTILAATKLGYKAIGIEQNADYCEIAKKRCETVDDLFTNVV